MLLALSMGYFLVTFNHFSILLKLWHVLRFLFKLAKRLQNLTAVLCLLVFQPRSKCSLKSKAVNVYSIQFFKLPKNFLKFLSTGRPMITSIAVSILLKNNKYAPLNVPPDWGDISHITFQIHCVGRAVIGKKPTQVRTNLWYEKGIVSLILLTFCGFP